MEQEQKKDKDISFDMYLINKEKRRKSRSKGKRAYVKGKLRNHTDKPRVSEFNGYNINDYLDDSEDELY